MISRFVSLCLPSTGSCFVMISRFVSLCLPSTGSCFVMISRFVSLCLPSTGSCFVMISRFVSLCLPSTGSCFVMISRFVSLCLPSTRVPSWFPGLSPFVSFLLDSVRHDLQVSLSLSPFYWIQFRHDFQVCLPLCPFHWIQSVMISRFVSLCLPLLDPVPSWSRGLSPFVSLVLDPGPSTLCLRSPVHHAYFEACQSPFVFHSTESSPIIILRFLPVCPLLPAILISKLSPLVSLCVSLCLPSTGSNSVMISRLVCRLPSTGSLVPFVPLLIPQRRDPNPPQFRGLSPFVPC